MFLCGISSSIHSAENSLSSPSIQTRITKSAVINRLDEGQAAVSLLATVGGGEVLSCVHTGTEAKGLELLQMVSLDGCERVS